MWSTFLLNDIISPEVCKGSICVLKRNAEANISLVQMQTYKGDMLMAPCKVTANESDMRGAGVTMHPQNIN